jgi:hypothetical protein
MTPTRPSAFLCAAVAAAIMAGCGMDDAGESHGTAAGGARDAQTPPQGYAAIEGWLKTGGYKRWQCEPAVHPARSPSPHGFNRICSNDLISANATGMDSWPKGAAAVKELLASANDTEPVGYAVYSKTDSDSDEGAGWYWYERVPADHPAPHDSRGVVADGPGDDGPEKMICVSCHSAAGSDDAHTPSTGSRDQVYTPVE